MWPVDLRANLSCCLSMVSLSSGIPGDTKYGSSARTTGGCSTVNLCSKQAYISVCVQVCGSGPEGVWGDRQTTGHP